MNFEKLFRILSYVTVFCGFFALWIAGAFGISGTALFVGAMVAAWFLEGTRWQVSERLGTVLIVLAVPIYFGLWQIGFFSLTSEAMLPGILARLILSLSAIKLLQKKTDRDWIFLYIMGFFQVLLAAGLSISALYLFAFVLFVFFMVCTIILFEMRKTNRAVCERASVKRDEAEPARLGLPGFARIPGTAVSLIVVIVIIAGPMFFLIPRVGGAGIGADPGGVSTRSGFSDTVRLGGIGSIQQNDAVVMRVRLEGSDATGNLKWRGIALDTFDGQSWKKSRPNSREPRTKGDRDLIQVDYATGRESLLLQTIYLEPLDTPVLFAAPRAVGIQGNFSVLMKDAYGGLSFQRSGERISYKVLSDTSVSPASKLQADREAYPVQFGNYLQLPDGFDSRIVELANTITSESRSRYDAAVAIENHLQTQFGYTLEQKASGSDPLADFLFNVREGHCEYFATAMALMLRSQGIATRVVTGFQQGDYNETVDVFVVRQRLAHAWVEVYFPGEDAWVSFDPTPAAGQGSGVAATGVTAQFNKYLEALEMFWIQYFVAFDNQEQRSLFTSVKKSFVDYQSKATSYVDTLQGMIVEWWKDVSGEKGFESRVSAIGYGVAIVVFSIAFILLVISMVKRLRKSTLLTRIAAWFRPKEQTTIVEFYERMQHLLAERGFVREPFQTPLEFAYGINIPEAIKTTERYNLVRYGDRELTRAERDEIEGWLGTFAGKS